MKNKNRYSTATSHPAARTLFALGAAVTALAASSLLTGCGGGGGGNPDPSPSASANQTVITGRVVDVNAGSVGVSGATVRFGGVSAQTNSSGNFSLTVPRNTAGGAVTITAPSGTIFYDYASISAPSFSCANSPSFSVAGPLTGATVAVGNILVYSRTSNSLPPTPCI